MSNPIKRSLSVEQRALRKGNFYIGTGDVAKGPTSETGWWAGVDVPSGGYTIYVHKANQGPSIYTAANDAQLITITNQIAGTSFTTVNQCFTHYAGQSDRMVVNATYPQINTNGLVFLLDAGYLPSYPRTGTTWYDVSTSQFNGTLTNGAVWNSNGWMILDGVDDYISVSSPQSLNPGTGSFTIEGLIFQKDDGINGVIETRGTGLRGFLFILNANSSGNNIPGMATVFFTTSTGVTYSSSVNTFNDVNIWMYVTLVVNTQNNTIAFFKNGVQQGSSRTITNPGSLDPGSGYRYWIGADLGGPDANINVSSYRHYSRVLSPQEILSNYYRGPLVTEGLSLAIDAGNLVSFSPGTTTVRSLSSTDTGTLLNGVTFDPGDGGNWNFDGVNDYIEFGNILNYTTSNFTFCFFVRLTSLTTNIGGQGPVIFYKGSLQVNGYYCQIQTNGRTSFATSQNGVTQITRTPVGTISANNWYHIGIVRNGASCIIYVNGIPSNETSASHINPASSSNNFLIGRYASSIQMNGRISQFLSYDRALTQAEIIQNYISQNNRFNVLEDYEILWNSYNTRADADSAFTQEQSGIIFDRTRDFIIINR